MKALVGTFNQEKALVGAFYVILKSSRTFLNPSFAALVDSVPAALYSAALKLPPRPACLPRVVAPDVARGAAIATLFQHKIPPFPP